MESGGFPPGKVNKDLFDDVIFPRLGAPDSSVLVGPCHGVDAAIVRVAPGLVMGVTTDPFFVLPELGWERAGWFAIQIVASDLATTGLVPSQIAIDLNLPLDAGRRELEPLWDAVDQACRRIGLAIVTGHTARYVGCSWPTIGAATAWAFGPEDRFLTPTMARVGDLVLVTKGAAIETTGVFGTVFAPHVEAALGAPLAQRAARRFWEASCVADARAAVSVGVREDGVTTLHDATERGIDGGLVEIARASGVGLRIDREAIPVPEDVQAVAGLFGFDPFAASSEGTLLLTCRPGRAEAVLNALAGEGIPAAVIGECRPVADGLVVLEGGNPRELTAPVVDPYAEAFDRAWAAGWHRPQ